MTRPRFRVNLADWEICLIKGLGDRHVSQQERSSPAFPFPTALCTITSSPRSSGAKPAAVIRSELPPHLVVSEKIKYTGLDDAFVAHCRLRRLLIVPCSQWFEPTV